MFDLFIHLGSQILTTLIIDLFFHKNKCKTVCMILYTYNLQVVLHQ